MLWQQYTGHRASRLNKAQRSRQVLRWLCILRRGLVCFARASCILRGVVYCIIALLCSAVEDDKFANATPLACFADVPVSAIEFRTMIQRKLGLPLTALHLQQEEIWLGRISAANVGSEENRVALRRQACTLSE